MRVLITGASGYVGTRLIRKLNEQGDQVTGVSRGISRNVPSRPAASYIHEVLDITPDAQWGHLLNNKDAVVHLADGFNAFEHLPAITRNTRALERLDATLHLAREAIRCGVPNFVYLSTIKAMCGSWADEVLDEHTTPHPTSLYGRLKLATEWKIMDLAEGSATRIIILRFPVVFGVRADGNFSRLLRLVDTAAPLPFKGLSARRSMISLKRLTDAIATVVADQGCAGGTFLVHDGAISIEQLITYLRIGLNRPIRLYHIPPSLWSLAEALPKTRDIAHRFTRPLELTDDRFRKNFSWTPPMDMGDDLRQTARAYRRASGRRLSNSV